MGEKIVLRTVIEFISGPQLTTYPQTHGSNTNSQRSQSNNPHCVTVFLGGSDVRLLAGTICTVHFVTTRVLHAEIIAQLGCQGVVTVGETKALFHMVNLVEQGDLFGTRKETGFDGIGGQLA
jgi:hypothetical protein